VYYICVFPKIYYIQFLIFCCKNIKKYSTKSISKQNFGIFASDMRTIITTIAAVLVIQFCSEAQTIKWEKVDEGLYYAETDAPVKSDVNDSKITVLKIDPSKYKFEIATASQNKCNPKPLSEWCADKNLMAGVNATMFSVFNNRRANGYLRNYKHINNGKLKGGYGAMAVFNPKKGKKVPPFQIIDMSCTDWQSLKSSYNCFAQSIRMIDCNSQKVEWKAKPDMRSSMSVLAADNDGNALFIFTRSPYSANQFSDMLLALPLNIKNAMYLDGGPESSFYLCHNGFEICKFGCYVTDTYERDDNDYYWNIPNIIGISKK